jgi:putative ABC transport system permease protein
VPLEGRSFARIDEVVVGHDVALDLGAEFEPLHGAFEHDEAEAHEGFHYRVVGRMPRLGSPWDRAIIAPIEAIWWVHSLPLGHDVPDDILWPDGLNGTPSLEAVPLGPPWKADATPGIPAIVVKPASIGAAYQLRADFRAKAETMALFPAEVLVQLYNLLGDVRDLLAWLSVLTQVLVMGAVLLAVLTVLTLRRKTIAVLQALGASRLFVFATVWLTVALLLTMGAVLGLSLGFGAAALISTLFAAKTGVALPAGLGWQEVRLVASVIVIGLVLATMPAISAYRGPVASALRS